MCVVCDDSIITNSNSINLLGYNDLQGRLDTKVVKILNSKWI